MVTSDSIRILHVEDDSEFAELAATFLKREDDRFVVESVTSAALGLERLDAEAFDCVLSDHDIPGRNGIEFLEAVRAEFDDLPFILFTGKGSEEVAADAISSGVTDYLQKRVGTDQYKLLAKRIADAVEQVRTDRARRRAEARFRAFTENTTLVVLTIDETGTVTYVNDAIENVLGYPPEVVRGESLSVIIPDRFTDDHFEAVGRYLETGERRLDWNELPARHADGHEVTLGISFGETVVDGDRYFTGVVRDITERTERERQLERKNRQFEAVFNNPVSFMAILELDGTVRRVNETAHSFAGVAPQEVRGEPFPETPWWDHSAELQSDLRTWIDRAADGEFVRYEADHYASDGESITIDGTLYPVTADDGEVTAIVAVGRDVSERTERERVLRKIHTVIADADRSFTEQVEAILEIACDALGTEFGTLSQVRGDEYVFEVVRAPDDSLQAGDTVPLSSTNCERTVTNENTLVLSNIGEEAPELTEKAGYEEWGIACYLGAPITVGGEVYGTFCFYDDEPRQEDFSEWDVTLVDLLSQWVNYELTRQRTREQLERQNERLNDFASVISHDLRNPLNVAQGRLALARDESDSDHLDDVARALGRMEALIEDLLTLAHEGETATDVTSVDLGELVESSWRNVDTKEATLATDTVRTVRADSVRLQQLLENLIRNAVEHGGDDVTVTVGDLDVPAAAGPTDESVRGFYVEDDGRGIPDAERDEVFEFGYSTNEGGTGFGLAIAKEISEAHGWDLRSTKGADGGARFEITGVEIE